MKRKTLVLCISVSGMLLNGCVASKSEDIVPGTTKAYETEKAFETTEISETAGPEDEDIGALQEKYGAYWNANYIVGDGTFIAYLTEDQQVYVCMGNKGQILDAPAGASALLKLGDAELLIFYPDRETLVYSLWDRHHEFSVTALDKSEWSGECQAENLGAYRMFEYEKSLVHLKNVKELWADNSGCEMIARTSDGTIFSHMISVPVEQWTEMAEIQSVNFGAIGLRQDGTVLLQQKTEDVPSEYDISYDVSGWENIVDLEGGIFGLKRDGTVVCSGKISTDLSEWNDICQISYDNYLAALHWDGTVSVEWVWDKFSLYDPINMEDWKDIQAIKIWYGGLIGITEDGDVLATKIKDNDRIDWQFPTDAPKAYVPEKPEKGF